MSIFAKILVLLSPIRITKEIIKLTACCLPYLIGSKSPVLCPIKLKNSRNSQKKQTGEGKYKRQGFLNPYMLKDEKNFMHHT